MFPPLRIVCLTEETVETLYLLGEQGRILSWTNRASHTLQALRAIVPYSQRAERGSGDG